MRRFVILFISKNFDVNEQGHLTIGGVDAVKLAHDYKTPLYVVDEAYFRKKCRKLKSILHKFYGENGLVCYASKAFCCKEIYRIVQSENLGIDVVSVGEMFTALKAGFNPLKIYFHGNNKSAYEIKFAIENGIGRIVVDNFEELNLIEKIAAELKTNVDIMFRLKPGVDAHVHEFIRTGQIGSKFGFAISNGEAFSAFEKVLSLEHVNLVGAHCHIGSQILQTEPFVLAAKIMMEFFNEVKQKLKFDLKELNLGGGFGINYLSGDESLDVDRCLELVFQELKSQCEKFNLKMPFLVLEPGRFLIAKAGVTLYTVGCVKEIAGVKKYVFVDGGMTDNPRYALYRSEYEVAIANRAGDEKVEEVSVAGKCCESGDLIGENLPIQKAKKGDVLSVFATGAYNYSMASNYNRLLRPAVIFLNGSEVKLAVKRETLQQLVENDV